jgi:hypothetical protein
MIVFCVIYSPCPGGVLDDCILLSPLNQYITSVENLIKAKTIFHIIALTAIFVCHYKQSREKLATILSMTAKSLETCRSMDGGLYNQLSINE